MSFYSSLNSFSDVLTASFFFGITTMEQSIVMHCSSVVGMRSPHEAIRIPPCISLPIFFAHDIPEKEFET